jgi:putative ATPase
MKQAESDRLSGLKTMVFVDEIHRFNKAQQDAFLPYVEKGSIILIGATTENPSFEINSALLSRCKVFVLHPLTVTDLCCFIMP